MHSSSYTDVWQYAQNIDSQSSSPKLQCPKFLLMFHCVDMIDRLIVHMADFGLQVDSYHMNQSSIWSHIFKTIQHDSKFLSKPKHAYHTQYSRARE